MTKFLTVIFCLLLPAFATAEEPTEAAAETPSEPRLCLVSTSLDNGTETLTNVHADAQLLVGQRGSVKLTLEYETRAEGACQQVTLELPDEGTVGDASIKVGTSTLVVANAGVMTHAKGTLVVAGDSLVTEHDSTPQS